MEHDEAIKQMRELGVVPGDVVEVQFADGGTAQAPLAHHPLAGWCVRPNGIPMTFSRIVRKIA